MRPFFHKNSAKASFGHANRVVIVTGGSQGIGEACSRRFAAEGAHVVLADVDDAKGSALASDAASYVTGEIVTVDGGRMTLNYTVPV